MFECLISQYTELSLHADRCVIFQVTPACCYFGWAQTFFVCSSAVAFCFVFFWTYCGWFQRCFHNPILGMLFSDGRTLRSCLSQRIFSSFTGPVPEISDVLGSIAVPEDSMIVRNLYCDKAPVLDELKMLKIGLVWWTHSFSALRTGIVVPVFVGLFVFKPPVNGFLNNGQKGFCLWRLHLIVESIHCTSWILKPDSGAPMTPGHAIE